MDPIKNLGDDDKLVVQKSRPLFELWKSDLTLAEFKILDTYLARINSHHPEKRVVIFEKGELEEKLGVKKINNKDLENRLKHLMGNVVKIPDYDEKKGFRLITLFEEAVAEQDEDGLWQIKMECTQKAMKYIFNIDNIGYYRYKLRCITSITSRYTYIMFMYLEDNRFRKSWDEPLDNLRKLLRCDGEEFYNEFKYFNAKILKRIHKEMHEKTECRYSYTPVKKGRSVIAVHFEVETLSDYIESNDGLDQIETEVWQEAVEANKESELWQEPLSGFNFSKEQLDELQSLLMTIPNYRLPQSPACYGNIDLMLYHYIDQKAKEIIRRDSQKKIKNKFAYLVKLLKNDVTA